MAAGTPSEYDSVGDSEPEGDRAAAGVDGSEVSIGKIGCHEGKNGKYFYGGLNDNAFRIHA